MEPLVEPPNGIHANGLGSAEESFKHLLNPFFANVVLPTPGGP